MVRTIKKTWRKITWPTYVALVLLCLIGAGLTHLARAHADSLQNQDISGTVQPLWPTNDANLTGHTALLAMVNGVAGNDYDMFWYVGTGTWNWMDASKNSSDIKQADIDLNGWHWRSDNTYNISFVAVMHSNHARIFSTVQVHVDDSLSQSTVAVIQAAAVSAATAKAAAQTASQAAAVVAQQKSATFATSNSSTANSGQLSLYVDPTNVVSQKLGGVSDATAKRILSRLSGQPMANWYGGWNTDVTADVNGYVSAASNVNQMPVLVAYNIPDRDCGGYSSGGSNSTSGYLSWIQSFANGIGNRPAMVLLEPDALAQMDCLSGGDQASRFSLMSTAVSILKSNPRTKVYIDAGNPTWISASSIANRLKQANIASADGFSLDISNYIGNNENLNYGKQISSQVGGKHFVIDTSRNGNGAGSDWCNPSGRALGPSPTTNTGNALADDYLWVKAPGGSDGQCNGGGDAGSWSASAAVSLAQSAGW
jgi:endoglucanase